MKKLLFSGCFLLLSLMLSAQTKLWGTASSGGRYRAGTLFSMDGTGANYNVEYDFIQENGSNPSSSHLTEVNGKLYGVLVQGGRYDKGVLYEFDPVTGVYAVKHEFDGVSGKSDGGSLVLASDGKLYGMGSGGLNGFVIYQYDPVSGIYLKKIDVAAAPGSYGKIAMIEATDGKLYGSTVGGGINGMGVLFQYDFVTNTYTKKVDFNASLGNAPVGELCQASDGKLYGVTYTGGANNKGAVFCYDITTGICIKKADFNGPVGEYPQNGLVEGLPGILYAATSAGGTFNQGTIYKFDLTTSVCTGLMDLNLQISGTGSYGALLLASDGMLYGSTNTGGGPGTFGVIFQFDPGTNIFTKKAGLSYTYPDSIGIQPLGALKQASNGKIYGLTTYRGPSGAGTIFQYDPGTSVFNRKFEFAKGAKGKNPGTTLVTTINGDLYGITESGGAFNSGVIFQFNTTTHTYIKKIDLEYATTGVGEKSTLISSANGKLYGLSHFGGTNGGGILFEYDPATNVCTKKIDFGLASVGFYPMGALLEASDGKLYGCVRGDGGGAAGSPPSAGIGALFQYDITTNTIVKKVDFSNLNEARPLTGLVQMANGKIYGTASVGGAYNGGVLFEYDPIAGTYTKKVDFKLSTTGERPIALVKAGNGNLYGLLEYAATSPNSALFEYDPVSAVVLKIAETNGFLYEYMENSLMLASDGNIYGVSSNGGGRDSGNVFRFNPGTQLLTSISNCDKSKGYYPRAGLVDAEMFTGFKETTNTNILNIYPNPNTGFFTVKTNQSGTDPVEVRLTDIMGRIIFTKTVSTVSHAIEFKEDQLPAGMYFVELSQKDKPVVKGKIIIDR